jgi:polysaccharide export outer membrane protein
MRLLLLLPTAALLLAGGCKFDQGPRMEMKDFLRRMAEEEENELALKEGGIGNPAPPPPPAVYSVGPGDVLEINMVGLLAPRQVSGFARRVRQDGKVSLPYLDGKDVTLEVQNLTPDKIEELVSEKYKEYIKDPQVNVMVAQYKMTPVVVMGHVNQPGLVQLKRDELNLLTAIAKAGWISQASNGTVTLKSAKGGKETFNLWLAPDVSKALTRDVEIGDIIEVERRPADMAFVMGLVRGGGGPVQIPPGTRMTLLGLLASSGGLDPNVDPREATLIRTAANGEILRVRVDFNRIFNNTDPDFVIKPGDILDVYHTDRTRALEFANRLIRVGVGAGLDMTYNPFMWGFGGFGR